MNIQSLLSPLNVGEMTLRNRIIMPAMGTNYADRHGYVTEKTIKYYERRAQGGVGLIVTELALIDQLGKFSAFELCIDRDACIDGLSHLAESIKKHGAKAVVQLHHSGRQTKSKVIGAQPVSASSVRCPWSGEVPRELTLEEIEILVERYAEAAVRAKKAGFDAVELHGAHGYFINQFLSPYSNKRTDRYGGSVENRVRFPLEIIKKIKERLGQKFPVLIKISGDEHVEGGLALDESKKIAKLLERGGVNAITVSAGVFETSEWMVPPMRLPRGCHVHLAKGIKEVVSIPVATIGRIYDPLMAEEILREGKADLIAMGRALIADPDLPKKVMNGDLSGIRKCIGCNNCADKVFKEVDITCTVNPEVSREFYGELSKASRSRRVIIAGAGPGGLEAARILGMRGHNVTLYEQSDKVGGQVNLGILGPHKQQVANILDFYKEQLKRLRLEVKFGQSLTKEIMEEEKPDVVILGTGSIPLIPKIPGINGKKVVIARDVLAGKVNVGGKIIVAGGGTVGCETAEFLAERGHSVTIIEMLKYVGLDIESVTRRLIHRDLKKLSVKILTNAKIVEIGNDEVIYVDSDGQKKSIKGDNIVNALGAVANDELLKELSGKANIFSIGDCVKPRKIIDAIFEGWNTARQV